MKIRTKLFYNSFLSIILFFIVLIIIFIKFNLVNFESKEALVTIEILKRTTSMEITIVDYFERHNERGKNQFISQYTALKKIIHKTKFDHEDAQIILNEIDKSLDFIINNSNDFFNNTKNLKSSYDKSSSDYQSYILSQFMIKSYKIVSDSISLNNLINKKVSEIQNSLDLILIILILSFTIIVSINSYKINKTIINSIKKLQQKIEIISKGDYKSKIEIISNNEIGELASKFNAMAFNLENSYSSLQNEIHNRIITEQNLLNLNRLYSLLKNINLIITKTDEIQKLFEMICESIIENGKFKFTFIGLVDEKQNILNITAKSGICENNFISDNYNLSGKNTEVFIKSIIENTFIVYNNYYNIQQSEKEESQKIKSSISIPLNIYSKTKGVLSIYSNKKNFFDEEQTNLLIEITNEISYAIEKIEIEKTKKINEKILNLIVETVPNGIIFEDKNGETIFTNKMAEEFLNLKEFKENINILSIKNINLKKTNNETLTEEEEVYLKFLDSGKPIMNKEYILENESGNKRALSITLVPVHKKTMNIDGLITSIIDITERKMVEEIVRILNEELEQKISERTAQLTAYTKELEAFSYSVSHDLRSPLRNIEGFSKALFEDYGQELSGEAKDYLNRIVYSSQKMSQLIEDLLTLSKITQVDISTEEINLSKIIEKIISEFKENDQNRKVEIKINKGIKIKGDEKLIKIAMQNILNNAWKFTSKQEVTKIEFGEKIINNDKTFFIKDNGAGFDMNYLSKLFMPFQRLHNYTEFPGTGIGLAIVQRIVHKHGGKIWAESELEKGATFYFTFWTN